MVVIYKHLDRLPPYPHTLN